MVSVSGCVNSGSQGSVPTGGGRMTGGSATSPGAGGAGPGGGMMGNGGSSANNYSSDGERIFLTGVDAQGQVISHTAPRVSQGALMMGGGGCASCHAANGRGGTIRMMTGAAIVAPDITYPALIKTGFTDTTIAGAIRDGRDEAGKPLDDAMPRWQMSDADIAATIAYLKALGAQ